MRVAQSEFIKAVLDPNRPVPAGIASAKSSNPEKRFAVYRNNVVVSLVNALETGFPVIQKLLGSQFFRAMAGVYARQHPPRSPLLMFYGSEFPDFLEQFEPVRHLPYLPDVATLELLVRESYHSADSVPVDASAVHSIPKEKIASSRLELAPSLRILKSNYPIHGIWTMNMGGGAKPVPRPEAVLVVRRQFDPELELLGPGEFEFVTAIKSFLTIDEANKLALAQHGGFDLFTMLVRLLRFEAITGLSSSES